MSAAMAGGRGNGVGQAPALLSAALCVLLSEVEVSSLMEIDVSSVVVDVVSVVVVEVWSRRRAVPEAT